MRRPPAAGEIALLPPVLDLRGEVCPMTFVRTRVALADRPPATCLTVIIDHAPALESLPRSLADIGCRVVGRHALGGGEHALRILRGEEGSWGV